MYTTANLEKPQICVLYLCVHFPREKKGEEKPFLEVGDREGIYNDCWKEQCTCTFRRGLELGVGRLWPQLLLNKGTLAAPYFEQELFVVMWIIAQF
jgi:hypothetical protein